MFGPRKKKNERSIVTLLEGSVTSRSPGGILARLFRKILKETNIIYVVKSLIDNYEKNSDKDKSQIQASVISEDMTWKTFTDLVSNLLDVKSFSVSITLVHKVKDAEGNHKVTVHHVDAKPHNDINSLSTEKEKEADGVQRNKTKKNG